MKLSATHAFNCIVLMVKFGLTSCEDIPPALVYALSFGYYDIAINVTISMAVLQFLLIIIHHIISNVCGGVIMYKLRIIINSTVKWITRSQNKLKERIQLNNPPPDKAYNYQELREPLVGQD